MMERLLMRVFISDMNVKRFVLMQHQVAESS